mgnify:CR=1 FL=1
MARVSVTVDPSLERYVDRLLKTSTYQPIVERLVEEAEDIERKARETWPVSRTIRGKPREDKKHSRDQFEVVVELTPSAMRVRLVNAAEYITYIRSYLTGLTDSEQRRLVRLRRGEDYMDRLLRVRSGRRRSALTTLISRPARRALPDLLRDLGADLRRLASHGTR